MIEHDDADYITGYGTDDWGGWELWTPTKEIGFLW